MRLSNQNTLARSAERIFDKIKSAKTQNQKKSGARNLQDLNQANLANQLLYEQKKTSFRISVGRNVSIINVRSIEDKFESHSEALAPLKSGGAVFVASRDEIDLAGMVQENLVDQKL